MQAYHFHGLDASKKHFIFPNASFVHFSNSTTSQSVTRCSTLQKYTVKRRHLWLSKTFTVPRNANAPVGAAEVESRYDQHRTASRPAANPRQHRGSASAAGTAFKTASRFVWPFKESFKSSTASNQSAQSAPGSQVFNHISFVNLLARQQTAWEKESEYLRFFCCFCPNDDRYMPGDSKGSALPC